MRERIKRLRARFEGLDIDAFLVTNSAKVRYLTGFTGDTGACLVTQKASYFIGDSRFAEQAEKEVRGSKVIIAYGPLSEIVSNKKFFSGLKKIGLESDMPLGIYWRLCQSCNQTTFISVGNLVDKLAAIKDKIEIQKIQKATEFTENIFEHHIVPQVRPGITENDLAAEITYWGKKYGAERDAFDVIVASGMRSSLPHGYASPKELEEGDMVQFDFGYVLDGYPSDFSRVIFLGKPTKKQKGIYNIVRTAQEMAIKEAKPGMKCKDLDAIARNYLKSKDHDLPHALGHGLGILVHSAPRISFEVEEELKPGYVVTIEPGVYIPDWGGIRIEDVIVITEDGCRNLTKFTKEMIVIR